ncbi:MAG: phosphoglucosamine mutase [Elusimicrobiota bacterium]|nr:phosphoglucosamine mutase [Elusimicrobiota bacterium]
MGKLFGTDGIRGLTWEYPFTVDFLKKIGYAASYIIGHSPLCPKDDRTVVIGMDSRESGEIIKKALAEGISANGFKIIDLGITTTPAVSYLVKREKANFGIVISASHNPPEFNGIKFFSSEGLKLTDDAERRIEEMLLGGEEIKIESSHVNIEKIDYSRDYIDFVKSTLPKDFNLKGKKIVLDCANGAAFSIAPTIFRELGAEIKVIGNTPDGKNINMGFGALHNQKMLKETVGFGAFCGISFDGDADRCIFSDELGNVLDGDDLISIAAPYMLERGRLTNKKVVLTFMTNCGLIKYFNKEGVEVQQVAVGDKNVTEAMEKEDLKIGGETSGHIILREFAPTGDGILTALQIVAMVQDTGKSFSYFKKHWNRYPQFIVSHRVEYKIPFDEIAGFNAKIKEMEEKLAGNGRIFIRYSGTEPLLRLLVEGESEDFVKEIADTIMEHYKKYGGKFDEKRKIRN